MLFDEKILISVMAILVLCLGVRFGFPQIAAFYSTDLIIFFAGGLGLMTTFHHAGYIEGFKKGVEYGQTTLHKN